MVGIGGTYDVVPGKGVGLFQLGDSLWHILDVLRTNKVQYPKVEISWDPENSTKFALVIHLAHLTLYFPSSMHQILTLILVPSVASSNLALTYETQTLHSANQPLTRGRVGRILGPTYGGTGDKLVYPGISFELDQTSGSAGSRDETVRSLTVTAKKEDGPEPLSPLVGCQILPNKGVVLLTPDPLEIIIGVTTAQDLLLDLGAPVRKFYKEDDRMARMWGNEQDSDKGSCFWNYFQYGLDFLVSSRGILLKIICHSNIPGTPLFQRHARCPWIISTTVGELNWASPIAQFRSGLSDAPAPAEGQYESEVRLVVPTTNASGKKKKRGGSASSVSSNASGVKSTEDLSDAAPSSARRGRAEVSDDVMILDRVGEGGLDGVEKLGPSRLIGFEGLILEEDESSGGICSVLVYNNGQ